MTSNNPTANNLFLVARTAVWAFCMPVDYRSHLQMAVTAQDWMTVFFSYYTIDQTDQVIITGRLRD